jgi:hypothetical protein
LARDPRLGEVVDDDRVGPVDDGRVQVALGPVDDEARIVAVVARPLLPAERLEVGVVGHVRQGRPLVVARRAGFV